MSPVASTTVEMKGALTTAGSTPAQRATVGMREPTEVARIQIATTVTATTAAIGQPTNRAAGNSPTVARVTPSSAPVDISRKNTRKKSRSEEHTSELQSRGHLVCRLLLGK